MTLISVVRYLGDLQATPGRMLLNGEQFAFTLEPRRDQSQGKPFCIPAAVYDYEVGPSEHFGFDVIKVLNVPGFTAVECHPGNAPKDTHACCLVGETQSQDWVGQSRAAFDELMQRIDRTGKIEYREN